METEYLGTIEMGYVSINISEKSASYSKTERRRISQLVYFSFTLTNSLPAFPLQLPKEELYPESCKPNDNAFLLAPTPTPSQFLQSITSVREKNHNFTAASII